MSNTDLRPMAHRGGTEPVRTGRPRATRTDNGRISAHRPVPSVSLRSTNITTPFSRRLARSTGGRGTPFEVIVGAILTQNTSWTNVERAIANLRREGLLTPTAIEQVPLRRLQSLIRPSGYFRQKARKLKAFCAIPARGISAARSRGCSRRRRSMLREKLLGVFGIGPETADSILLYAGDHAVFVVDAYTKRCSRATAGPTKKRSTTTSAGCSRGSFPANAKRFNEFHALIVNTGKNFAARAIRCAASARWGAISRRALA